MRPGAEFLWAAGALSLAVAFASASQDIAIDAYAVEILRREEQGVAVGARIAVYRAALVVSGGASITMAGRLGWPTVNLILALLYLPMILITWKAPEPEEKTLAPTSLRDAVWQPFLGFLSRHRALEILAFVLLYKFSDQLTQAVTRPFMIDMGYNADWETLSYKLREWSLHYALCADFLRCAAVSRPRHPSDRRHLSCCVKGDGVFFSFA